MNVNYLNLSFLSLLHNNTQIFYNTVKANYKNYQNVNFIDIINFTNYDEQLNKISNIDFIFLSFMPLSYMLAALIKFNIARMFELYTFLKIINKINIGGSICIFLNQIFYDINLKLIAFYCSFFEEYYITYPEIHNDNNFDCIYLILKNKKNINKNDNSIVADLLAELIKNSPTLNINHDLFTIENETKHHNNKTFITFKEYFSNFNENLINNVDINNPDIEKIFIDVQKEYINIFNTLGYGITKLKEYFKDIFTQNENNILSNDKIIEIKQQNTEECKKWARKYNMPLIPEYNIGHFDFSYENIMYRDIVSFEKDIYFKFKSYKNNNPDINFTSINEFYNLPLFFEKMIGKAKEDIRAFDYRNIDIYKSIKDKIDYYYKKITYVISFTYDLPCEHVNNDEWLKITEILNKINIIDKTKSSFKSFHICEFSGSYINAISFFLNLKANNMIWSWKAQRLNPKITTKYNDNLITNDLDIIHNDVQYDESILYNYYSNYDFAVDDTGDITKYENIQYYRNKYNDNDLITAGCGGSGGSGDSCIDKHILSYSQYLMIFSCCKKGGNAIFKRIFPIDNTQELNMLYLFYCLFETTIVYKPKLNYHSQEYYLIGLNYKGICNKLLDNLIDFIKDYKSIGFLSDMPTNFTLQVDKMQNELIENMNKFIKKQIYFCDNYENIKDDTWKILKTGIKEKIKDWLNDLLV